MNFYNNLFYLFTRRFLIIDKKIERKFGISVFFFFPFRLITRFLEIIFFTSIKKLKSKKILSNYVIDINKIKKKNFLNVISIGVANNIDFDLKLIKNFNINKIIFIDPSIYSKNFVKKKMKNLKLNYYYELKAMSNQVKNKIKIYTAPYNLEPNWSLDNSFQSDKYILVNTINYKHLIKKYKIKNLNILKIDAEGFTDQILLDVLNSKILPEQICFELERPYSMLRQLSYFLRVYQLKKKLSTYYDIYFHTYLKIGMRMELLAIKK